MADFVCTQQTTTANSCAQSAMRRVNRTLLKQLAVLSLASGLLWSGADCSEYTGISGSGSVSMYGSGSGSGSGSASSGDGECPDGFTGPNCEPCVRDVYTGECETPCTIEDTCSGHGRCRGWDGTCICYEGWSGAHCSEYTGISGLGSGSMYGSGSGSGSGSAGSVDEFTCAAGFAGPYGGPCVQCEEGKYKERAGFGDCDSCPAGKFTAAAGVNTACTDCPAGKYSTKVGANSDLFCDECSVGTFNDSPGASGCEECPAGTKQAEAGINIACDNCEAGKYKAQAGINTACDNCDAGKYKAQAGVNVACDNCEAGKYKAQAGVNMACDHCEAGKYKARAGVNVACDNCGPGKYKAGAGVNVACDNCDTGKYKAEAGINTACDHCEAGKYKAQAGVNTACDNCEAGKYKAQAGVNVACDNCEAGKYKAQAGVNVACGNCDAGKYKAQPGVNVACDNCDAGKYKALAGVNLVCDHCEASKYSDQQSTTCFGAPSPPSEFLLVAQSIHTFLFRWTMPDEYFTQIRVQPVRYVATVSCGEQTMKLIYNDSEAVMRRMFLSTLKLEWQTSQTVRSFQLTPGDEAYFLLASAPIRCTLGESVTFDVTARNRFASSLPAPLAFTPIAPPTAVQGLTSKEIFDGIMVTWERPVDTGRGDRAEPIIQYLIESSTCPTFSTKIAECLYHQQAYFVEDKISLNFNLTRAVLERPGETYFIRVTAKNSVGLGQTSPVLQQRFMIRPKLLSPIVSEKEPLRITTDNDFFHIWNDGTLRKDNRIRLTISGLDLMVAMEDLKVSIHFMGQALDDVLSISNLVSSGLHVTFSITLPRRECPLTFAACPAKIEFFSRLAPSSRVPFFIEYFRYPNPEVISVMPRGGPDSGGSNVNVQVLDFVGAESRSGAGLPSLNDALDTAAAVFGGVSIAAECGDGAMSPEVPVVISQAVSSARGTSDAIRFYDLSFQTPPSPCGADAVNLRIILRVAKSCAQQNCSWQPDVDVRFLYRAPGIVDVTPKSGMINYGSDPVVITVLLENIGKNHHGIKVTLNNITCVQVESPVEIVIDQTQTLVQIQIEAPRLPREDAGLLPLDIRGNAFGPFVYTWQYLKPPSPSVQMNSIQINGEYREPLWVKQRSSSSTESSPTFQLQLSNLHPKFDTAYSDLQVWFDGSRSRVGLETIQQLNVNAEITFEVDTRGMPAGLYNMTVHVIREFRVVYVLSVSESIEIRDMSVPAIVDGGIAPTEGPMSGGTLVLVAISGASKLIDDVTVSFAVEHVESKVRRSGTVRAGPISLAELQANAAAFSDYLNRGSQGLKAAYSGVVANVQKVISPDEISVFMIVQMPDMDLHGAVNGELLFAGVDAMTLKFDFTLVQTPDASIVQSALTADGSASGIMAGGYLISVILYNFIITYDISKLSIQFGKQSGEIFQLQQSNSAVTKFSALVPPGDPGIVIVTIQHDDFPQNVAEFSFEYIDDRIPEVLSVSRFKVYADGGYDIRLVTTKFPSDLEPSEVTIEMMDAGTGQLLGDNITAIEESTRIEQASASEDDFVIVFKTPAVDIDADTAVRARVVARGRFAEFDLQVKVVPTGPPQITPMQPLTGFCTKGGQKFSLILHNMKMITDTAEMNVKFGNHSLDDITLRSSMTETIIIFQIPVLPEDVIGPIPLSVWVGNGASATINFECMDSRRAVLLYTLPAFGDAGPQKLVARVGLGRMGDLTGKHVYAIRLVLPFHAYFPCAHKIVFTADIQSVCSHVGVQINVTSWRVSSLDVTEVR